MKFPLLLVFLASLVLVSCGGFVKVDPAGSTIVQAGVLSSIQGLTVQVTPGAPGAPPTITLVQTGYDGTSFANNAVGTIVPVATIHGATNIARSNNHLSGIQSHDGVLNHAIDKPITNSSQTIDSSTGTVLTNTATKAPFPRFFNGGKGG